MASGVENLKQMLSFADEVDIREGYLAYERYNAVMRGLGSYYCVPLQQVVAAFVSLSPNNDYISNLRSTASVLYAVKHGVDVQRVNVSTYRHCRNRAYEYATGQKEFSDWTKGLKILNFFCNIVDPTDNRYVTIDGHMVAAYRAQRLTMKQAIVRPVEYRVIAADTKRLAFELFMLPHQLQAIIWFARKRRFNVKYSGQLSMWQGSDDLWQTLQDPEFIRPYPPLSAKQLARVSEPHPLLHSMFEYDV